MKDKIDVGAIGTFGLPNGCTQSGFYNGKIKTHNKSLDLNANAIKIFPNTILYVLRREIITNELSLIFGKYSFAKEKNSNRGGTFVGSFISFYNCISNANHICSLLNEFHTNLIKNENNILNSILQVSHSKDFQVTLPKDFEKLNENILPLDVLEFISSTISTNQNFVVYCEEATEDKIVNFFQNCSAFFPNCETIYFTHSKEIATFVKEKGLLKIIHFSDFEYEITNIKIKKTEEQNRAEEQRKQVQIKQKEQAKTETSKKKHLIENNNFFSKRNPQNNNIHNLVEHNKQLVTDFNKLLTLYKDLEKKFFFSNPISNNSFIKQQAESTNDFKKVMQNSSSKKMLFYIAIPIFCFSLLLSNLFLVFFQKPKIEYVQNLKKVLNNDTIQFKSLDPISNRALQQAEEKIVFQKIIKGKKIGEIVNLIFKNNPSEISKLFLFQKINYQNNLFKVNKKLFKIENDTVCVNGNGFKLPTFKNTTN